MAALDQYRRLERRLKILTSQKVNHRTLEAIREQMAALWHTLTAEERREVERARR